MRQPTETSIVFENAEVRCWHQSEPVLVLSLIGQPPRIGPVILDAIEEAITTAEAESRPLVVCTEQAHFAFGANLDDAFTSLLDGSAAPLERALERYQAVMLALRHAAIPTVAAVRGMAVSGGCELVMHCTGAVAEAGANIGLLEPRLGLIPGGGGLKEFAWRAAGAAHSTEDLRQRLEARARMIAAGTLAHGARQAIELGFLAESDEVASTESLLPIATQRAQALLARGYTPAPRDPLVRVAGRAFLAAWIESQRTLLDSGAQSPRQHEVAVRVGAVLCGGDTDDAEVREHRLLALEREHFLVLAQSPETQAVLKSVMARATN